MSIESANALAGAGAEVWFASSGGPLRENLHADVTWLRTNNPNHAPIQTTAQLARHIHKIQPAIVHSHGATCSVVAALASRRVKPRPARVLTHHSRIFRRAPLSVSSWLMRKSSDHYVAISRDKCDLLQQIGIPSEKISLIPNFVDVDAIAERVDAVDRSALRQSFGVPVDASVVLIAGRALPEKGFDRFVHILERTAGSLGSDVYGFAIGEGPALDDARRIASRSRIAATIQFPGYQRDIFPYLAIPDAVLFPTRHPEVLPMLLIEASASGCPSVCSDIPGNRDIVEHGRSGYLVGGNDEDYAQHLTRLLQDRELRTRMGEEARRTALSRFDKRRIVDDLLTLYATLSNNPK